jgi:V/A-type H+-transporting ATPase subunit E
MDIQLKELIETIKREGIDSADSRAAEITGEAQSKAKTIIAKAEEDAARILADAKREIARNEQSSKEAITQAGRDLILSLEKRITALFDGVITAQTKEAFQGKGLEDAVAGIVKAWTAKGTAGLEVLLPAGELQKIESSLRAKLGEEFKKGVVLKPVARIDAGFRIGESGGSAHYDFTAEGVAEILSEYLNPKLAEIMKNLSKGA